VGASIPSGRLQTGDFREMAAIADRYGDGTVGAPGGWGGAAGAGAGRRRWRRAAAPPRPRQVRLTCEENVLFPNVPEASLPALLAEPFFLKYRVDPGGEGGGVGGVGWGGNGG
jgi:ferredoxin-nitrite reductase